MTNADTVLLAKQNLAVSNINPFTHKELISEKDQGITFYDVESNDLDTQKTTFTIHNENGLYINGDIRKPENWIKVEEN